MRAWSLAFAAMALLALPGCGYNGLQRQDEDVKAAWSEVLNQYQRRAELIPNLVRTVKGYANQELQVLIGVTEARAKEAGSIQLTPELVNNPEAFAKFQAVQGQLSGALKNLFAVTEAYPQLQSDANFRDLQVALEGTENRIAVARNRYIDAVRNYNVTVRSFPTNLTARMFDFQVKPNFTVANEQSISVAPTVDFGDSPAKQPPPAASGQPVTK
jgi:LemA protein